MQVHPALPFSQHQAPVTRGFLLLLIPLDSYCEICSVINHPFIYPICPDYRWFMGNVCTLRQESRWRKEAIDTPQLPIRWYFRILSLA